MVISSPPVLKNRSFSIPQLKAYADQYARGMEFKIRIKPGDPSVSVADSTVENWWNN